MIERKFIKELVAEMKVKEFLKKELARAGYSKSEIHKTPLGTKVIVYSARPALVVGRRGSNIRTIQDILKNKYGLEKPQIEVREIKFPELDAQIMAERVAMQLERFGPTRFKAIGHRTLRRIIDAGAKGAEIIISGKCPSKRAKSWRFFKGHIPKCGETSDTQVSKGFKQTILKQGIIGVTVYILPPGVRMPDEIRIKTNEVIVEEIEIEEETIKGPKEEKPKKTIKKKPEPKEKKQEQKPKKEKKPEPEQEKQKKGEK